MGYNQKPNLPPSCETLFCRRSFGRVGGRAGIDTASMNERIVYLLFSLAVRAVSRLSDDVSFTASIVSGYDVLVNEDKTRSFVCLRVRGGRHMVLKLIAKVDPLMRRFKQAAYYEVIRHAQLVTLRQCDTACTRPFFSIMWYIAARPFGGVGAMHRRLR